MGLGEPRGGGHGVEWSRADGERRLDSKSTLKTGLTGFGDGFEVRNERGVQDGSTLWGLTTAVTDFTFTEMGEAAVKKK